MFTSDHALKLEWVPDWIAIIGSGYIGLEFSDVYTALGSEVTFIEARLSFPLEACTGSGPRGAQHRPGVACLQFTPCPRLQGRLKQGALPSVQGCRVLVAGSGGGLIPQMQVMQANLAGHHCRSSRHGGPFSDSSADPVQACITTAGPAGRSGSWPQAGQQLASSSWTVSGADALAQHDMPELTIRCATLGRACPVLTPACPVLGSACPLSTPACPVLTPACPTGDGPAHAGL